MLRGRVRPVSANTARCVRCALDRHPATHSCAPDMPFAAPHLLSRWRPVASLPWQRSQTGSPLPSLPWRSPSSGRPSQAARTTSMGRRSARQQCTRCLTDSSGSGGRSRIQQHVCASCSVLVAGSSSLPESDAGLPRLCLFSKCRFFPMPCTAPIDSGQRTQCDISERWLPTAFTNELTGALGRTGQGQTKMKLTGEHGG